MITLSQNEEPTIQEAIEETRALITNMANSIRTRDSSQEEINAQDIPNEIRKYKDLSPVVKEYWDVRSYLTDISQLLLPTGDRVIDEHEADAQGTYWPHKYRIISSTGGDCTFFSNYRFCYCKEAMSTSDLKPIYFLLTCYKNTGDNAINLCELGTYRYTYDVGLAHRYGPSAPDSRPYKGYITSNKGTFQSNWGVNILVTDLPNCPLPVFDTLAEAYEYCRQEVTPTTIKPSSFPARILSVNKKQYLALNKKLYYHWTYAETPETSSTYAYNCNLYYDYPIAIFHPSGSTVYGLYTIYPGNNGGWFFSYVNMTYNSYEGSATRVNQSIGDSSVQSGFNKFVSPVWNNTKPTSTANISFNINAAQSSGFRIFEGSSGDTMQDVFEYLVYQQTGKYAAPNGRLYKYKYTIYGVHTYQEFTTDADWYTNFPIGCYNHLEYANLSYLGDAWTGTSAAGSQTKCLMNLRDRNPGTYTDPLASETYCIVYYPGQPNNQALDVCVVVRGGEDGYTLHPYPSNNYPVYTKNTFPNFQTEAELIEYLNS